MHPLYQRYKIRDAEWATGLERAPLVFMQLKLWLEASFSKPVAHSTSLTLYVLSIYLEEEVCTRNQSKSTEQTFQRFPESTSIKQREALGERQKGLSSSS